MQHVINKFKSYKIIEIDERIAAARRRRTVKRNTLKIRNRNAWTQISENFKKAQQQKIEILIKIMNKNTNQCQSIERIKKIQKNSIKHELIFNEFCFSISFISWKCDLKNGAISSRWSKRKSIKLFWFLSTIRRVLKRDKLLLNDIIRRLQRKRID